MPARGAGQHCAAPRTSARITALALVFAAFLLMTGCGDQAELTERAFVVGAALDATDDGKLLLTLQVYKPSQSVAAKGKNGKPYVNVKTSGRTVIEAIRDITIHLGRKAQFSHMRAILVSDKLARQGNLDKILDVFYRDNEPRLTCSVIITRGEAGRYLDVAPLIESTISQQYYLTERTTTRFSGKSVHMSLLKLAIQLRKAAGTATLPYLNFSTGDQTTTKPSMAGVAIIQGGKMVDKMLGFDSEGLLLLKNAYRGGMIEVACPSGDGQESVEILDVDTSKKISVTDENVNVEYRMRVDVAAMELTCSSIMGSSDEKALGESIAKQVESHAMSAFTHLQRSKSDAVDIGNTIYKYHPSVWRRLKADWPERFAQADVRFNVEVVFVSHGTSGGKPFLSGPQE
ncbi:spore germination protein KC [Paenibacillus phyllosphaerae]|uniref:Spore germination protein KC n=1 Tax=Paenibacillus phyllosphaerae TaxID=274593 RepID=A0A7W5AW84_9BACL|nr:Ger(x)C family spore germination protein [Paenibacillus phyllosphaerae]MBB3109822.1 spore germination protein KC [Paenibacillus phyllosphaerae]